MLSLQRDHWFGFATLVAVMICAGVARSEEDTETDNVDAGYQQHVVPFFKTHCIRCHGPQQSKGKLSVHALDRDLTSGRDVEHWESILTMLEFGQMPPDDEPQPTKAEKAVVEKWIGAGLRDYVANAKQSRREPTTRRLTNVEYENTLSDLVGIDLKVIDDLSKDPEKPYHFNNTATLMRMGPEQVDRYLEVARRVMASVIVDPEKPEVHRTRREWQRYGLDRGMALDEIGVYGNRRNSAASGMGLKSFPERGEFRVRLQAAAILPSGTAEVPLRLLMGYGLGVNSATLQVAPIGTVRLRNSPDDPKVFEFTGRIENFPRQPGRIVNGVRRPDTLTITPQNLFDDGTLNDGRNNLEFPRVVLEWMEFEAPLTTVWPPSHHTAILFDSPLRENDPEAYITEVLKRFLSRAYRRPATPDEVTRFVQIYKVVQSQQESFEAAVRETLAMVLISPQFLYRTDQKSAALEQYALASRLSYFLWASMPDQELLDLAANGTLNDPQVIGAQVERMLADKRAARFVENFTMQWLSLAKMKTVPINQQLFPRFLYYVSAGERSGTEVPYRPTIRDHMLDETVMFVSELIKRNSSVLNIVDSDFACLNQRLAVHYGVPGVEGDELRPVKIKPEHHLGGLLTHGSVLIGNGTGSAPHPIYRAVWLREAILGEDVAAPPAEVPALSDSAGDSADEATTIKDLLAKHRSVQSCNDCHFRLDPWGIPFESYSAIGQFQPKIPKPGTRVRGVDRRSGESLAEYKNYLAQINTVDVQATSRVPHGPEINGLAELKMHLLQDRSSEIAENVIRRLMTYSLGRELTWHDRFEIKELTSQAADNDFRLRDIIISICTSDTFRQSRQESK